VVSQIGIEVCKNLALLTPAKLTVSDDNEVDDFDESFNWFYRPHYYGKKKSDAIVSELFLMNPFLNINQIQTDSITEDVVKTYDIFILTDCYNQNVIDGWDVICRQNNVGFLLVSCIGMFGSLFVDFGPKFRVLDKFNMTKKNHYNIKNITRSKPGVITIQDVGRQFVLETGDFVTIREVEGMTEVNGNEARPIKVLDSTSFSIENTSSYTSYLKGGLVIPEPVPMTLKFDSFRDNLNKPKFKSTDNGNFSQIEMHVCMMIYYELREELEEEVCLVADQFEETEISQLVSDILLSREFIRKMVAQNGLDVSKLKKLTLKLVNSKKGQFLPVSHMMANLASTQVICYTGKFMPIYQSVNFEVASQFADTFLESLSFSEYNPLDHHLETYGNLTDKILNHMNLK